MAARKAATVGSDAVTITAPNMKFGQIPIRGTSQFVYNAFSQEAADMMAEDMAKGSVDKARKKKDPKDFESQYQGSLHIADEGWPGIPVIAFRAAMVRAAQMCGIEMTKAKMCVFVECDGYEPDGRGLVRITKGKPERFDMPVRQANGSTTIRARGRLVLGWEATVTIQFDADFMSPTSVTNLLMRAGINVGIGAGRPFSTMSVGQGWGTFELIN